MKFDDENDQKARFLIVDDAEVNRLVLKNMIVELGYAADAVASGQEAFKHIEATDTAGILMDLRMPGLDGIETTRQIRNSEISTVADIPIVIVTADMSTSQKDDCVAAGVSGFLTKPVMMDDLSQAIENLIKANTTILDHSVIDSLSAAVPKDRLVSLLGSYKASAKDLLLDAQGAIEAGDLEKMTRAVHSLKGSSASIGLVALAEKCLGVEVAYKEQRAVDALTLFSALPEMTVEAINAVEEVISQLEG